YHHRDGNGIMTGHSREQLDGLRYTSTEQRKTVHQYATPHYAIETEPVGTLSPASGNGYGYADGYGYGDSGEGYTVTTYTNGYADEGDEAGGREAGYSLSTRVVTVGGGGVYDPDPNMLSPGAASTGNRSYRSGGGDSYLRTNSQQRFNNGDAYGDDDPYANLPPQQNQQLPTRVAGSNLSLSNAPYLNGVGSHGSGIERYSSNSEFNQQHQQQTNSHQHEYVNYTDPDVVAVRQSLETARIVSSRTSSFGRDVGGGSGGYLASGSLSDSRQRIVAYEPELETGSQGFGNLGYNGGGIDGPDEVGGFYSIGATAAAAAAANTGASARHASQYQSHLGTGSISTAVAAAPAAVSPQPVSNLAALSQVHLQQQQQQQQTTTTTQVQQQIVEQPGANYRNPELPDLIEYLRTGSETTKCHAAAYLQHLTFCEEAIKSQVRAAGGIPLLVRLLSTGESGSTELQRNVLGALRNLSYGQRQEENKREMCKAGGLQEARRLLETSPDQDVKELATAVMWNISVSPTLKKDVLDTCLDTLVQRVLLPHAGLERRGEVYTNVQREIYWTVLFRNATGVIRSVSSCGDYARRRLRSADGLVESLRQIIQCAVDNSDLDGKAVENCVCTLRNLVYACQEVEDPAYLRRHAARATGGSGRGGTGAGCFGRRSSRGASSGSGASGKPGATSGAPTIIQRRLNGPPRGMDLLWQLDIVPLLLPIVADCTNPETLEAAAGALQNLAACDWQPSVDIRAHVRKERGLPLLVELLGLDADKVVQTAATALRNLAQDERNKDLIGKYALEALTGRLPGAPTPQGAPAPFNSSTSSETYAAVIATLYTVLKDNFEFSRHFLELGGVRLLMNSARDPAGRYGQKVSDFSWTLLVALWRIRELQPLLRQAGWTEAQFTPPKRSGSGVGGSGGKATPMGGPGMSQSGPGARQDSMPKSRLVARQAQPQQQGFENSAFSGDQQQQQLPMASRELTYAQVDKDRSVQQLHQQDAPAVDSWV
ncbi:hypothetical protein BOX15_Mlig021555g2, partial [Macrostomum lignano]